jgi:hypothetical protein
MQKREREHEPEGRSRRAGSSERWGGEVAAGREAPEVIGMRGVGAGGRAWRAQRAAEPGANGTEQRADQHKMLCEEDDGMNS